MKHQLKNDTMCHPKDKAQAIEILRLARQRGLLYDTGYNLDVLDGKRNWPMTNKWYDKTISYARNIYAFGHPTDKVIPVEEFIARLKGEWVEPSQANTSTLSRETRELLAGMLRDAFDKLDDTQLITSAPVLIKAASELGFNKLAKGMRDDLNF